MLDDLDEQDTEILRTAVEEAAGRPLEPGGPDIAAAVERVRGRRRRRALAQVGSATASVAAVAAVVTVVAIGFGSDGGQAVAPTASTPGSAATQPEPPGVVCGRRLTAQYAAQAPGGVQVVVTGVHTTGPAAAPSVDVAITAGRNLRVAGSPRQLGIQVVVIRGGMVVDRIGGAQWPEDYRPKPGETGGSGGAARSWQIDAGRPHAEQITPSHWTACPGVDWTAIHADPGDYQLMALMPMPQVFDTEGPLAGPPDGLLGSAAVALRF
ncbi:MAG: hypothetical protein ACJ786_09960 [Catenulispora sp.]